MWSKWRQSNYTFFQKKLPVSDNKKRLVDLGAGELQFAKLFKRYDYIGVDFVAYPGVAIIADLTQSIPLSGETADIVTLSNTLEHIPNPDNLIYESHRILKPGGCIIGTVPFLLPVHQAPYDFNRYTHFQLKRFLDNAGFKEIEVVPLGSLFDALDTIEQKSFDELQTHYLLRVLRRAITKLLMPDVPSTNKVTQGYGFYAVKL